MRRKLLKAEDGYLDALLAYTTAMADLAQGIGDASVAMGQYENESHTPDKRLPYHATASSQSSHEPAKLDQSPEIAAAYVGIAIIFVVGKFAGSVATAARAIPMCRKKLVKPTAGSRARSKSGNANADTGSSSNRQCSTRSGKA